MSVANADEARKALKLAQDYRDKGSYSVALKWARKSSSLSPSSEATSLTASLEKEIASGATSTSTPSKDATSSATKATGAETHPSASGTHQRPGHGSPSAGGTSGSSTKDGGDAKSRSFTPEQTKVVKRVIACKAHEYYSILAVEKSCSEGEVRKAYRKLALALHPDKNGAPRADEAFKMVSKAFQVLSDNNLRAAYDSNPHQDPSSRGGGGGGGGPIMATRGFGGGNPGFHQSEISPEDLFRAFFGGGGFDQFGGGGGGFGGGPVFTFGGPNGFRQFGGNQGMHARARDNRRESPPPNWVQMLPLLFLVFIGLLSWLPGMFSTPDPGYQWKSISPWTLHKQTSSINVDYWVNPREWQRHPIFESIPEGKRGMEQAGTYSNKLKRFESGIEQHYVSTLRQQCGNEREDRRDRKSVV